MNVHPTKHEVRFLHEDLIIEAIQKSVEEALLGCNSSRTYYTQSLLPSTSASAGDTGYDQDKKTSTVEAKTCDYKMVRTDANEKKLDAFFVPESLVNEIRCGSGQDVGTTQQRARKNVDLTSVLSLQNAIRKKRHTGEDRYVPM